MVVGRVRQLFLCVCSVCLLVVVRENEEEKKREKSSRYQSAAINPQGPEIIRLEKHFKENDEG